MTVKQKGIDKFKKGEYNYTKPNIKAVTKRAESLSLKRVGGWCEPITNAFKCLWLLSRRSERFYGVRVFRVIAASRRKAC